MLSPLGGSSSAVRLDRWLFLFSHGKFMNSSPRTFTFLKLGLLPMLALGLLACEASLGNVPPESEPVLGPDGKPIPGDGDGDRNGDGDGDGLAGDGDGDGDGAVEFSPFAPQPGQLRRLTRTQFRNSVFDLVGTSIDIELIEADSHSGHFSTVGAATVTTSPLGAEQYLAAVETAVDEAYADQASWTALLGCTPVAGDPSCFRSFLESAGARAFRRPLTAVEIDELTAVAATAELELGSAEEGTRWGTIALLSSMHFLYRPELGTLGASSAEGGDVLRISGYEMATRLAFLIYNSLPDQELLAEAASGALDTKEGVVAAAQRMLGTPRAREAVAAFAEDYMRLDRIFGQPKDPTLYPAYNAALREGMRQDMREVWAQVAFDDDASALDLFSTRRVYANAELATLYGLDPTGLDSSTFATLDLPMDGSRGGILSKAGFLSQFANQIEGSPTLRGKFIREALLCQNVPVPPPNLALELPEANPDAPTTKRERLAMHSTVDACSHCHAMMDPLGFPLEQFDAIGEFRTTELGLTIDASGEFDGTPVTDAANLGEVLNESDTVAACLVQKFYSYALGRPKLPTDNGTIHELTGPFAESGHRMRELILDLVESDAFSMVTSQPE